MATYIISSEQDELEKMINKANSLREELAAKILDIDDFSEVQKDISDISNQLDKLYSDIGILMLNTHRKITVE